MPRFMSPLRPHLGKQLDTLQDLPSGSIQVTSTAEGSPHNPTPENSEPEYPETCCISEGTFRRIRDDSLVLLSQGIEHRLFRTEEGPFQIYILPEHQAKATHQLELYHKENPPKEENPPIPLTFSLQPFWILLVPTIVTLMDFSSGNLHDMGVSNAAKIMQGQWWRSITAMTLHADARHIFSNLLTGYIVMNMITYRIPLLRLAPFIAVASALANFGVALTVHNYNPGFSSLGYSTLVFAAIGCLAVIEFRLMPSNTKGMLRRFAPLCGAASLAIFLGLGENADILGHAYGFIAGLLCGLIPKKKSLRWGTPLTTADGVGYLAYCGLFILAWKMAF